MVDLMAELTQEEINVDLFDEVKHLKNELESEQTLRILHERKVHELENRISEALETLKNCDGSYQIETNEAVDHAIQELEGGGE